MFYIALVLLGSPWLGGLVPPPARAQRLSRSTLYILDVSSWFPWPYGDTSVDFGLRLSFYLHDNVILPCSRRERIVPLARRCSFALSVPGASAFLLVGCTFIPLP